MADNKNTNKTSAIIRLNEILGRDNPLPPCPDNTSYFVESDEREENNRLEALIQLQNRNEYDPVRNVILSNCGHDDVEPEIYLTHYNFKHPGYIKYYSHKDQWCYSMREYAVFLITGYFTEDYESIATPEQKKDLDRLIKGIY